MSGGLATWTILQNDDPNHIGLRCNAIHEHQMALITSVRWAMSGMWERSSWR